MLRVNSAFESAAIFPRVVLTPWASDAIAPPDSGGAVDAVVWFPWARTVGARCGSAGGGGVGDAHVAAVAALLSSVGSVGASVAACQRPISCLLGRRELYRPDPGFRRRARVQGRVAELIRFLGVGTAVCAEATPPCTAVRTEATPHAPASDSAAIPPFAVLTPWASDAAAPSDSGCGVGAATAPSSSFSITL